MEANPEGPAAKPNEAEPTELKQTQGTPTQAQGSQRDERGKAEDPEPMEHQLEPPEQHPPSQP